MKINKDLFINKLKQLKNIVHRWVYNKLKFEKHAVESFHKLYYDTHIYSKTMEASRWPPESTSWTA